MFKKISGVLIFVLAFTILLGQEKEDKFLLLKIGDPKYKDKILEISIKSNYSMKIGDIPWSSIYSIEKGRAIPFSEMIREMKKSRLIYIGESHNSLPMHDIQLRIIQSIYKQDKNISLGLEMFPVGSQEILNKWSLGILSKEEFIREARWYVNWNFNFGFYEKIFEFAKENRVPLYALNIPRTIIRKIRMKGWEALSEGEKKNVPKPDLTHKDHRTLIRAIFESTELPPQMKGKDLDMAFEGLYRAQSAWDEVMAFNTLRALKYDGKKMIVLAGSGHLLYNLGINRRAFEQSQLPFNTVISLPIPEEKESVEVSRSLADYIWGIPEEKRPAFPSVGLSFKKFDGLENLVIERKPIEGASKGRDFEKGDIVLSVDGKTFSDINLLRMYLAQFTWGDEVKFRLLRNAQEREVSLKFQLPEKFSEKKDEKINK